MILSSIILYSQLFGIDPRLAISVARVESRMNSNAVGSLGEIGLFQVRPEYVDVSKDDLYNPTTNIITALKIMTDVKKRCKYKSNFTWLVCYNRGVTGGSKVRNPLVDSYYKKVMKEYKVVRLNKCTREVANELVI